MAAVRDGLDVLTQAKLLPFSEKQTMGSLPGILNNAQVTLEDLKEVGSHI
jgi:hypothetical protein